MPIEQNIGVAVERNVTLVETGLRSFRSSSGPGARAPSLLEKGSSLTHWAVDV